MSSSSILAPNDCPPNSRLRRHEEARVNKLCRPHLMLTRAFWQRMCFRLALCVIAPVLSPNLSFADNDGYLPLGPHVFASVSFESPLEYRDILLSSPVSANFAFAGTYRGFSVSVWHANDLSSTASAATEFYAAYSHKLPIVDFHVGVVSCSVSGRLNSCSNSARFSISSNSLRNTNLVFKLDQSFSNANRIFNLAGAHTIYAKNGLRLDVRLSGTHWNYAQFSANGFTARAIIGKKLRDNLGANFFVGLIESEISRNRTTSRVGAPILGSSLSWSF
jgi:hypothetical protein